MKLIVCIDDKGGMAFNHRRQSRDVLQRKHMNQFFSGQILYMSRYSYKLFSEDLKDVDCRLIENLSDLGDYDTVFVEKENVSLYMNAVDKIYVYRWNTSYPADLFFPVNVLKDYKLEKSEEFVGKSHETIGFEVYVK